MVASYGHQARFAIGAANPVSNQFEILSSTVKKTGNYIESPGMRGTRSYIAESVAPGQSQVGGAWTLDPRPDDLDYLLPLILGSVAAGNSFTLAETVPSVYLLEDKVAGIYLYTGMKVNSAEFDAAESSQDLKLTINWEGISESETIFPSIAGTLSVRRPYTLAEGVITVASTPYPMKNLKIKIDNVLALDRFYNSATRISLPETDRIITVTFDSPFSSAEKALYDLALAGAAATVVFTNGSYVLTFDFVNLKSTKDGPTVPGKTVEIGQSLSLKAFQSGATKELVVTNVGP